MSDNLNVACANLLPRRDYNVSNAGTGHRRLWEKVMSSVIRGDNMRIRGKFQSNSFEVPLIVRSLQQA